MKGLQLKCRSVIEREKLFRGEEGLRCVGMLEKRNGSSGWEFKGLLVLCLWPRSMHVFMMKVWKMGNIRVNFL